MRSRMVYPYLELAHRAWTDLTGELYAETSTSAIGWLLYRIASANKDDKVQAYLPHTARAAPHAPHRSPHRPLPAPTGHSDTAHYQLQLATVTPPSPVASRLSTASTASLSMDAG